MNIYTDDTALSEILRIKKEYIRFSPQIKKDKELLCWVNKIIAKNYSEFEGSISAKIFLVLNPGYNIICPYGTVQKYQKTLKIFTCPNSCQCVIDKKQNQYLKTIGYENPMKNPSIKAKQKQSLFKKFGVTNPSLSNDIQQKKIKTCIKNFGVSFPFQSKVVQDKSKITNIKNFGYENPSQSPIIKQKKLDTFNSGDFVAKRNIQQQQTRKTNLDRFDVEYYVQKHISKKSLTILNSKELITELLQKYSFTEIAFQLKVSYKTVLSRYHFYNPKKFLIKGTSSYETEISSWLTEQNIKFIAKNRSILTDNTLGKLSKELDFYLPEFQVGIEFQGTYWHMDPRKYNSTDINKVTKLSASQTWERDNYKYNLCHWHGILLIIIWQLDWDLNKNKIKEQILNRLQLSKEEASF